MSNLLKKFKSTLLNESNIDKNSENTEKDMQEMIDYILSSIVHQVQLLFVETFMLKTSENNLLVSSSERICMINPENKKILNDFNISTSKITSLAVSNKLFYGNNEGFITCEDLSSRAIDFIIKIDDKPIDLLKIFDNSLYASCGEKITITDIFTKETDTLIETSEKISVFDVFENTVVAAAKNL